MHGGKSLPEMCDAPKQTGGCAVQCGTAKLRPRRMLDFFVHEPRRVSPKKKIQFRPGTRTEGGCRRLNVSFCLRFFLRLIVGYTDSSARGSVKAARLSEDAGFFPVMCGFSGGARRDVDDMPGKRGYSQLCLPTGFIPNLHEQKLSE